MAGDVVNIKVCSPLKLRSGLTGKCHAICHYSYNLPLCKIAKDRELGNETKIKGQYACKIKIVSLKLKFIEMKQKIENKRDYDKERKELFDNAIKKVDPRIQKTIELIEKINNSNVQIKYELSTSCSSTTI